MTARAAAVALGISPVHHGLQKKNHQLRFASHSELVPERDAEYPRPKGCLCDDELIGADERARMRIAEVLTVRGHDPGILRDAD